MSGDLLTRLYPAASNKRRVVKTKVYLRFAENVVGTSQRVTMSRGIVMPRYAFLNGERDSTGRWSLPVYPMNLADYIWFYENGKLEYIKNRCGQPIAEEELTLAHLSAVNLKT